MTAPEELDGQTSIDEVLADLGEPWTAEPLEDDEDVQPTLF